MANEKRLIDAKALWNYVKTTPISASTRVTIMCLLDIAPTVDAVEVVHAHWEPEGNTGYLRCSHCKDVYINEEWLESSKWNGCPNCFADLRGAKDG